MSDIQLAVLFITLALIGWYVRSGLERETGPSGVLAGGPPPPERGSRYGLRLLLLGHGANLIICIPLLALAPWSFEEGHYMLSWLSAFLTLWLRWAGLTQLIYAGPMWKSLHSRGLAAAARAAALGAGMTLAVSGLAWSAVLQREPHASYSLQGACGILALACAVALLWLARELRRTFKAGK